ncbi:hypothetical protein NW768_004416 [Fusarium equiseti]|uniref:Uncharacterized protein n=1 Tax=Fusarium equiseti TaxID=61235 RepID=A0ABQ8RG65_FUSEQ|nr:hypothetical protein NW768_004416 [Fusarium equiseti]
MPSDTPTKKQYEFPPQHDHMIQQSEDDVATSMAGDQVYVSAPGRKQFQHVWLWDTKYPKDTVTTYNVETHGPSVSKQSPLPDDTELQPHDMAVEMLEIGLVFANDPSKFHEEVRGQASRSKSRQTARDERGVMARNDTWFRAYIKVTDYIQTQAKTSVGCRILDGHLRYKTTSMRNVFFYKEFYPGSDVTTIKDHTSYVAQAIKHYSARIKELQPVTGVDKTASTASQALAPKVAVASNLDRLQMEDQLPPHDNNDGVSIFLAFDENITLNDEDIADLIEIVQVTTDHWGR